MTVTTLKIVFDVVCIRATEAFLATSLWGTSQQIFHITAATTHNSNQRKVSTGSLTSPFGLLNEFQCKYATVTLLTNA
jgi:hypothetical protein